MSLSPQQMIDTADGLVGLVNILNDPEGLKAKLEELKQYSKDGSEAFDKAGQALSESKNSLSKSEALSKEAQDIKTYYESEHARILAATAAQEQSLADLQDKAYSLREINLKKQEELNSLSNTLAAKESELNTKLSQVSATKKELEARLEEAVNTKNYHESLIAKVKASIG